MKMKNNYIQFKKHPQGFLDAIDRMVLNYTKTVNNKIIKQILYK